MVGDETVEGSGNILKYLGTRMDSERRDVGGRKVASICEWAITKHAELNGDFDDAALAATCTQIEIILNHDVDTEAGETFAGIAPSVCCPVLSRLLPCVLIVNPFARC